MPASSSRPPSELSAAAAPFAAAGAAFAELCGTLATLRAPGGCAWDRAQTPQSLRGCLIEEAYEVVDAVDAARPPQLRDELGDVLLQVIFQAALADEAGDFAVQDVVQAIDAKLQRRHPHVFGGAQAVSAADALRRWEDEKVRERGSRGGRFDGVPRSLPGLLRAARISEKAAAAGFDWPDVGPCEAKFHEEWKEFVAAWQQGDRPAMQDEMGDVLMSLVGLCRQLELDAEACIGLSINKLMRRFSYIERAVGSANLPKLTADTWEQHWQAAKAEERRATDLPAGPAAPAAD